MRTEAQTILWTFRVTPQKLATKLGISRQAVFKWRRIPAERVLKIEAITGIPKERLRPDLFKKPQRSK